MHDKSDASERSEEILSDYIEGRISKKKAISQLTALNVDVMGPEAARAFANECVFIAEGGSDVVIPD